MSKWQSHSIITATTMCSLAVRAYFVKAWMCEGEVGFNVLPVLSLRTDFSDRFVKDTGDEYETPERTADELVERGWRFEESGMETHAVVFDPEYGLIDADDYLMKDKGGGSAMVLCPWPFDEKCDTDLLSEVKQRLEKELRATIYETKNQK